MNMTWIGLLLALVVAIIASLAWWHSHNRRQASIAGPAAEPPSPPPDEPPYGWLTRQAKIPERHAIMAFPWRIGRSSKNDLCIDDPSVSRRHAEIRRGQDGHALIVDLESLNGIYINNQKTTNQALREGDRVEIGDIVFSYTLEKEADDNAGVDLSPPADTQDEARG